MSSLRHHDKMSRTKTNTQTTQKHVEHKDATDIQKQNYFLCFSDFSLFLFFLVIYNFLNEFFKKC